MSQLQLALSMVKDEKQSFFMYKMKEEKNYFIHSLGEHSLVMADFYLEVFHFIKFSF